MASRALENAVFRELGVHSGKPLSEATKPEIQAMLRPLENEDFPLDRFHDYSRLPIEQWKAWIDFPALKIELAKNPKIKMLATREGGRAFDDAVREALRWRAVKGYEEEWAHLTGGDIQKCVVNASGGVAAEANDANAEAAAADLRERIAVGRKVKVLDLGTGGGGTIVPVIERLSQKQRGMVEVHLVDVMSAGLRETKKKLKALGVGGVKTYKTNFYDLSYRAAGRRLPPRGFNPLKLVLGAVMGKRVAGLRGKMDLVVSGAALHHAADVEPVFEAVSKLTKDDGAVYLFDWGHSRTLTPTIDLDDPKLLKPIAPGAEGSPSHLDSIRAMTSTWLGLWGYDDRAKKLLAERLEQGGKFNFEEWLRKNKKELEPMRTRQTGYFAWCMEGHRNPLFYKQLLEKHGFGNAKIRYPFSKPGAYDSGNMLYLISARKR